MRTVGGFRSTRSSTSSGALDTTNRWGLFPGRPRSSGPRRGRSTRRPSGRRRVGAAVPGVRGGRPDDTGHRRRPRRRDGQQPRRVVGAGAGKLPEGLARRSASAPSERRTSSVLGAASTRTTSAGCWVAPGGRPCSANARHVVAGARRSRLCGRRRPIDAAAPIETPLRATGLLREVDGAPPLRPGSTSSRPRSRVGHQSVWVSSGDRGAAADRGRAGARRPLVAPEIGYAAEDDPAVAAATRSRMFAEAPAAGTARDRAPSGGLVHLP